MGTIIEDIAIGAEWISKALQSSGYKADFSPESLWEIDFFFDDHTKNGRAVRKGLLSKGLGKKLFALSGYVGEVLRRNLGGEWCVDEKDPMAEVNIRLEFSPGNVCWPGQRVIKRFKHGESDSIAVYGLGMGLQVGAKPERSEIKQVKKPWWKIG